jgi:hypothetical protein
MADKIKNIESSRESLPKGGKIERRDSEKGESKEISEKSREFVEGVSEVVEGAETAETTGEIAEGISEGKKKAPTGGTKSGTTGSAAVSKEIPPSIEIMRIQVATQIKKEIRILEKEAAKLMKGTGGFHPFKLNMVVSRIRTLSDILSGLAYATAETMKNWWMKYVKGITS